MGEEAADEQEEGLEAEEVREHSDCKGAKSQHSWESWGWHSSWGWSSTDWSGWRGWDRATDWGADSDVESDEEDFVEILPDAIKGWLLLEKASLDAMERQLIQSEIRGNFTLSAVENSLPEPLH